MYFIFRSDSVRCTSSRSTSDQTHSSEGTTQVKQRLLAPVVVIFGLLASLFLATAPASAEEYPSSQTANVWANHDNYSGYPVSQTWHHDPTPEDPYASSLCAPKECGSVTITYGKKGKVTLKKVSGEEFVYGYISYSDSKGRYYSEPWDGKPTPSTITVKKKGKKPVKLTATSAHAGLYNPAFPVPSYEPCCPGK